MPWRSELALRFVGDFVPSNAVADPGPRVQGVREAGTSVGGFKVALAEWSSLSAATFAEET
jgi:hypothetical protein